MITSYEWTASGGVSGIPTGTQTGSFGEYVVSNKTAKPITSTVYITPKYAEQGKECVGDSQSFDIVVNPTTVIESITANSNLLCEDEELRIEVSATGENLVYQWYKDSVVLQGERNREYVVFPAEKENTGTYYAEVYGFCGIAKSKYVRIDVRASKMLVEKWHDVIFVDNSTNEYAGYQWYRDGKIIDGATEQFYQEIGGLNGCYSVELRLKVGGKMRSCERCAYKTSKEKGISVYPNPNEGTFTINTNIDPQEVISVQVVSMLGQSIYKQSGLPSNIIQLPSSTSGVFYVEIITTTQKFIRKMVVQ